MKLIAKDFELASKTLYPYVEKPEQLPITYSIDEKTYQGMPKTAEKSVEQKDGYEEITYSALVDGLSVKTVARKYSDFPAVEWTVYFTNNGNTDSALLHNVKAIDNEFIGEKPIYTTCNGDFCSYDSYTVTDHDLTKENEVKQFPNGGRCSDNAFPYQRLCFDGFGYNIAIGWTAQWESKAIKTAHGVHFEAGQQELSSVLHPNETFRSPLILLVGFDGKVERGINVWRKFYLAHILPVSDNKPVGPFLNGGYAVPGTVEYSEATEENQIYYLNKSKEWDIPVNVWWIDAAWYDCHDIHGNVDWWTTVGNWKPEKERFPRGLKPVSEKCHELDCKLLLWYEAFRTTYIAPVVKEHPEWLIYDGELHERTCIMLDVLNPDCKEWLVKTLGDSIEENGVDIFRLDYNFEPLSLWKKQDEENRKGAHENLYVQTYLSILDALLSRFPNLIIDECASGGRIVDIESMSRCVLMHECDEAYGNHPVMHAYFQTLYSWIPFFCGKGENWEKPDGTYEKPAYYNTIVVPADDFSMYCNLAPMTSLSKYFMSANEYTESDWKNISDFSKLFYKVAPDMEYGDYYALTPNCRTPEQWKIWQFDVPEENRGIIEAIRYTLTAEETKTVFPFVADGTYVFTDLRTGETFEKTAEEMKKNGLTFAQPKRSAHIWSYVVKS